MVHRVAEWLHHFEALGWAAGVGLGALFMLLSLGLGFAVVLWLPHDYFVRAPAEPHLRQRHPILWVSLLIARNLLGLAVLLAGLVMAMPLVPGPGVFVALVGLGLLDFPGKHALQRRLLGERHILSSVNRIRARFGKASLLAQEKHRSMIDNHA